MDLDLETMGQTTPPGTPFDEDTTQHTTRDQHAPGSEAVRTENYYTLLSEDQVLAEAATTEMAATDEAEAEAAGATAAAFIANLAAEREALEAPEAAAAKATAEAEALAAAETAAFGTAAAGAVAPAEANAATTAGSAKPATPHPLV